MLPLVEKARIFATAAHAAVGQRRKYTDEPYIVHPIEVAKMVEEVGGTPEMIAAAFLHDVVEDTGITIETILAEFGSDVADLVAWLTDVSKPEDGNRAVRKAIDRAHLAQSPAEAMTIKIADLISNTRSILKHDKNFARIYLEEKRLLLEVLDKGDARLMAEARKLL